MYALMSFPTFIHQPNIVRVMKPRKMDTVKSLTRTGLERNIQKFVVWESGGKGSLWKSRCSREYALIETLQERFWITDNL